MSGSARPVRITDVAQRAGVSSMTVSRVVNGSAGVSDRSRQRVEAAVAELGYRPNPVARALATGRSASLGVVSLASLHHGPTSTLLAIDAAAQARGFSLALVSLQHAEPVALRSSLEHLRTLDVAGVVVLAPVRSVVEALPEGLHDKPYVLVSGGARPDGTVVRIDQASGSRLAVQHLLALGHRRVHHVAGPADWLEAEARTAAWRAALRRAGAGAPRPLTGDWTAESGFEAGRRLAADPTVTAVFAANDQMALGVLRALHEAGRRVPDDVSVVGFDDTPESAHYLPPLTTVRQDFQEVGRRSVGLLLDLLDGAPGRHVLLQPELVVRRSTAPPRP